MIARTDGISLATFSCCVAHRKVNELEDQLYETLGNGINGAHSADAAEGKVNKR